MHDLWRIAVDTPTYAADDRSGKGAEITGGRWNQKGVSAIYTASSRALACLETIVHFNAGGLPLNRFLVRFDIPDAIWSRAVAHSHVTAPIGWNAEPAGLVSISLGTAWLQSQASALLIVPSVIVPEECNVLINPAHPDSNLVRVSKIRQWVYDPRLVK
jgi:RES domain-containing protein